jgi:hypothetical protein
MASLSYNTARKRKCICQMLNCLWKYKIRPEDLLIAPLFQYVPRGSGYYQFFSGQQLVNIRGVRTADGEYCITNVGLPLLPDTSPCFPYSKEWISSYYYKTRFIEGVIKCLILEVREVRCQAWDLCSRESLLCDQSIIITETNYCQKQTKTSCIIRTNDI